jgi:hypothetical protein
MTDFILFLHKKGRAEARPTREHPINRSQLHAKHNF